MKTLKSAKTLTAEAADWEKHNAAKADRQLKLLKLWAVSATVVAVATTISVAPLMHFQHLQVAVMVFDKLTRTYYMQNDAVLHDDDPDWQIRAESDLARYVKAREGFTRGEADQNYKTVWLMDSQDLRASWDQYYRPDLNPKGAPLSFMRASDAWTLKDYSFSFIPSSEPDVHVAQVRYTYIKKVGMTPPTQQRMVSTVSFKYTKENLPNNVDDRMLNPVGFMATNYHRDDDGPVQPYSESGAAPTSVYPPMQTGTMPVQGAGSYAQAAQPQSGQGYQATVMNRLRQIMPGGNPANGGGAR